MEHRMPVARYFSLVGGVLLALLFIFDACFPNLPVAEKAKANLPVIRIHSVHKWPERTVYDTSLPTIVPTSIASTDEIVRAPETIADAPAGVKEREAFAMLPLSAVESQAPDARMREPKARHQSKIARKRPSAPRIAMARHLQFGWSGRSDW
jgi:hypothetical protein